MIRPSGKTVKLQSLNVSISKPFKSLLRKQVIGSLSEIEKIKETSFPKMGLYGAHLQNVADKIVYHSFKKWCIINELDGTEDHVIWPQVQINIYDSSSDSDSELDAIYGIYSIPTIDGESEQDI